jgi:hypothetical protein
MAEQEDFVKAFQVNPCYYNSEINAEDVSEIGQYIEKYMHSLHEKHFFKNVNVDEILYMSLQRHYLIADPRIKDDEVTRGFLQTILMTLIVIDKLCNQIKPKYVLSSHGVYSTWGAIVEYCKSHDIYVITWGRTYNKDGITFAFNDSYLKLDLVDKQAKWKDDEISEEQRQIVTNFYEERLGRKKCEFSYDYNKGNKNFYSSQRIKEMFNLAPETDIVGLFPNIPWDGQVTGESSVFPLYRDFLKQTVDFFANKKNIALVIRSHPAERLFGDTAGKETTASMLAELYPEMPSNILVLPPDHTVNSYTLGQNSIFGITYSSTVSLELTYLGVPIVLAGNPAFKNKGVVNDIKDKEDYIRLLELGCRGNLSVSETQRSNLFKFTFYHFFKTVMPERLIDIKSELGSGWKFIDENEMNEDAVLDYMFKSIENKADLDFSGFHK